MKNTKKLNMETYYGPDYDTKLASVCVFASIATSLIATIIFFI